MEFFAQPDIWPQEVASEDRNHFTQDSRLGEKARSVLAGVVRQDLQFPRWTMNE